jgi:hypothetical protein
MNTATRANMRALAGAGHLIAWCPSCGSQYSANAGDYFWLGDDTLECCEQPCILARIRPSVVEPV